MGFKLTIGEFLHVPISGTMKGDGRDVKFQFSLMARRIGLDAYREALGEGSTVTVREFLTANVTGWSGQRLVVDDDGEPAAFGPEAFELLLGVVGMEQTLLAAYLRALQISDTSAGRAKN